jgi:hypothetical protein
MTSVMPGHARLWVCQAVVCCVVVLVMTSPAGARELSASQPSPSQWASTVCGAVGTWLHRIEKGEGTAPANPDPPAIKEAVVRFVDNTAQATQSLLTKLRGLRTPNTPDGQSSATSIKNAFTQLKAELDSVEHSTTNLSTNDPGQLRTQLNALASQIQGGVNAARQSLREASNANPASSALTRALTGAKQCKAILSA